MANFKEHIQQAKNNLRFLYHVNKSINNSWDWQVTICFYVAVHLINAHIAKKINQHYRSHEQVNEAINPYRLSPAKFNETNYLSYIKLQSLARRSRYLCSENKSRKADSAFFTYDKHFSKSRIHLDKVLTFVNLEYNIDFGKLDIDCIEVKNLSLKYFTYKAK